MRARLGILLAEQEVLLRAIKLNNKPGEMLKASPKGTVPVLVIEGMGGTSKVIDESLDIMLWALKCADPQDLLYCNNAQFLPKMLKLIEQNDTEFVQDLGQYKAASRYRDVNLESARQKCEPFMEYLEDLLNEHQYLMGSTTSLADYALLPFVRQFSKVERQWFNHASYPKLKSWLAKHYENPIFSRTMSKYPLWMENKQDIVLGE